MGVTFPKIPPVGLAVAIADQRFDLVAVIDHTKADGAATKLLVWHAECATCGDGFITKSPVYSLPQGRRCDRHKQPGRPAKLKVK